MTDSLEGFRRKIDGARDLESVVRTMKALAASNIGQYERAVLSLKDYYHTVELGLAACLRWQPLTGPERQNGKGHVFVTVFGSDQGLVGQFNDVLADFVRSSLSSIEGEKKLWVMGERIRFRLEDLKLAPSMSYDVPQSVHAITPLITRLLLDFRESGGETNPSFYIFHHRPVSGALYEPVCQKLLPLDLAWHKKLRSIAWPSVNLPEVAGNREKVLLSLVHEYLFVSLFRSCAESLASENASRMAAMQRAEKNIAEILEDVTLSFNRLRQNAIDEELFDVISGFEALKKKKVKNKRRDKPNDFRQS